MPLNVTKVTRHNKLTFFQYQFHAKIDKLIDTTMNSMTEGLIHKLMSVLEGSLSKLARYDEGSLIGSLMSFAVGSMLLTSYVKVITLLFFSERVRVWERCWSRLCQLYA